jgi:hypothetical protein
VSFQTGTDIPEVSPFAEADRISLSITPETARGMLFYVPLKCHPETSLSGHGAPNPCGSRKTDPSTHTAGQTSETFSQAISRCSVTPSTIRGGGIRIISPFSNRTPRGCFVPIRLGSGAASTVVTSCLPSYV